MWRWLLVAVLLSGTLAQAAPLPFDAQGRRAVRGSPLDGGHESEALKALREFESESFPEGGSPEPAGEQDAGPVRAAALGATPSMIGPDAQPSELRSPARAPGESPAQPAAIPWLDQLKLPDLPIRLDPRVLRYLEFYKSDKRGRAIMAGWLKAQGRWRALMEDALRRAKLPLGLLYVSMIESGYDPHDRSHAGAVGLWQFMPEAARIYGLRVDYWVDERKNPEKATEAQMHYFADLKERFGGWSLALAAFNAGYGAVLRSMQKYNTNDYWELCRHEDGLPWDTILYVPKAMAAAIVGENKRLFGYEDVQPEAPFAFDRVTVPSSMSFAAIAHAAGTSESEIAALNPELRRKRTPPDGRYEVRVPRGAGKRFTAAYEAHKEAVKPYIVRFGERLDDLARDHGLTSKELRALNGIEDSAEVRPGLTLVVPADGKPLPAPPVETVIVAVPDKDATVPGKKRVFYRTLPQDSCEDIARFFKVKATDLGRWNALDLEAKLASGMVLQLWVDRSFDASQAALVDPSIVRVVTTGSDEFFDLIEARRGRVRLSYTVKPGDDLKKIGRKFGLTVADLERINRFGAQHTPLAVGQKITVYRNMTAAEKAKAKAQVTPGGAHVSDPEGSASRAADPERSASRAADPERSASRAADPERSASRASDGELPGGDPALSDASDEGDAARPLPLAKLPRLGKEPGKEPIARP